MPTEHEDERRGEGEEGRTQEEQDRAAEGGDGGSMEESAMKCSLCGRLFGSESELQLHMEQEHEADSAKQDPASS